MHTEIAAELMTAHPICLRPDERLDIALALMTACRFRHLPVEQDGRLHGILSLRDLYAADLSHLASTPRERGRHLRTIEARAVMTVPVVTAAPEDSMWQVARTLLQRRISCVPILDDEQLIGIVTRTDFLRPAIARLAEESTRQGAEVEVSRLMSARPLATVGPRDPLDLARALMSAEQVRHLPVVSGEEDRLIGILSDHDALAATGPEAPLSAEVLLERHATRVEEAMSMRVAAVQPEDSAADAARLLDKRRFGALPVVTAGGRLCGMLSVSDFFYYLLSLAPSHAGELRP